MRVRVDKSELRSDANKTLAMVGRRFGRLVVIRIEARAYFPSGNQALMVSAQCDCGRKANYFGAHVRSGRTTQCAACGKTKRARHGKDILSTRLPSGKTIAQLADETGIDKNTLTQRLGRGWTEAELSLRPLGPGRRRRVA
jgi:hypothetical protein